jgi:hypothetical protein
VRRSAIGALLGSALVLATSAAVARAESVVPVQGPWAGVSSVGLPLSFKVEGANVVDAHFSFNWGFCGVFESALSNTDPIDTEGNWSFIDGRGSSIEGTFASPERVEGTVKAVSRELPGCPATHASFLAVPGEVPPPAPLQYYTVMDTESGHQRRLPQEIYLGRFVSFVLFDMKWVDYGQSVVHGSGMAEIRQFKHRWTPAAKVTLRRPIPDGPGKRVYSRLSFSLSGPVPARYPRKGWFRFDRQGVVSSSDGRWPGGPGYVGGRHAPRG